MRVFTQDCKFDVDVRSDFLKISIWIFLENPNHPRFNIIHNMLDSDNNGYEDRLAASLELGILL